MNGLTPEARAAAQAFMDRDLYARHLGIELVEAEPGRAYVKLDITDDHRNGLGMAHGGAIFSLADLAFALASNVGGVPAVAINVSISYTKAATEGTLHAVAEEVSRSRRLATYTVRITDDADDLIALFQGTVYRKVR